MWGWGADAALHLKGNIEGSFAAAQLGMPLAGTIAAATGGAEAQELIAPLPLDGVRAARDHLEPLLAHGLIDVGRGRCNGYMSTV